MCPGTLIKGGGAGGSGDGSGNGSGGNGNNEAGANNGENDPNGDGKNGKCGAGGAAGCTGCSAKPAAGDPVDLATGEVYTTPSYDVFLPGPVDLQIQRTYSTRNGALDIGFGHGWSFSFGWRLTESGGKVTVVDGSGYAVEFKRPAVGQLNEAEGWVLERTAEGYVVGSGTPFIHHFRTLPSAPSEWLLAFVLAPGFNKIVLHHDNQRRLRTITDSAGRDIDLQLTPEGRVAAIDVTDRTTGATIRFGTYLYDQAGDLVAWTDADGVTLRYEYRDHRLTALRYPNGLTYHWIYDAERRCIETWGARSDGDPALDPDLPTFLADRNTRAKGLHHVKIEYGSGGAREVITTTELQRFFIGEHGMATKAVGNGGVTTRAFDANGQVRALTDRNGATTTYERDHHGRVLQETDPNGHSIKLVRNEAGDVVQATDAAGGVLEFTRDARGYVDTIEDQLGGVTQYRWDERGLMREQIHPNGGHSTYEVDAHGNLIEARLADGSVWKWRWDYWGRLLERIDPLSHSTRWAWTAAGRPAGVQERDGSSLTHDYDAMGDIVRTIRNDGKVWEYRWGGLHWLCDRVEPNGDTVKYRYDRLGKLVALHNEAGEMARFEWDTRGGLRRETTFDGRVIERRYDAMGRLISEDLGHGKIEYVRDDAAQIVEANYPDGVSETFSYNERRELVAIQGATTKISFDRDALGNVLRESVDCNGDTSVVETTYGRDGIRTRLSTSVGHVERFTRDGLGRPTAIDIDERDRVTFQRDPLGNVLRVDLPAGGVIASEYDPLTRVSRRCVLTSGAGAAAARTKEPDFLGVRRGPATVDNEYHYGAFDNLVSQRKSGDLIRYELDARDRLVAKIPDRGEPEVFSYDAANNVRLGKDRREEFAPGNKLVASGPARFAYDAAGFLVEKTITRDDGAEDVWAYEWSAARTLTAVSLPDGSRVEFDYLPLLRNRIQKRVYERVPHELEYRLKSKTRYVWDEERLVHDERVSYGDDGRETSRRLRTYLYEHTKAYAPMGEHITTTIGDARTEDWQFFATNFAGAPEAVVRADGTLAADIDRTAFGVMRARGDAPTDVRFPGQFEDEETGLFYNFFRYYDPDVGRYISPDPIGLVGNLNVYLYCTNPVAELDPYGLSMPMDFEVTHGSEVIIPQQQLTSGESVFFVGPTWRNLATGHAERKALVIMGEGSPAQAALQNGGTAKMSAPFPPCKVCHRLLKDYADQNCKNGGSIQYHYPTNQQITYNGSGAQGNGQQSQALVNAYAAPNQKILDPWLANQPGARIGHGRIGDDTQVPGYTTKSAVEYRAQKRAATTAIAANNGTKDGLVLWP